MSGDTDFTGRKVLVVGGSSGIGNGIAHALPHAGLRSMSGVRGPARRTTIPPRAPTLPASATPQSMSAIPMPSRPHRRLLTASMSSSSARAPSSTSAVSSSVAGWDKVMAVNLDSLMHCAMKFRAALAETKGSIVTVSSVAAWGANIGNPAYAASKAGAVSLTRTLGNAFAGEGIRVNGIAPGLVATKLTKVTTDHPERLAGSIARIPQGRLGTPEDMAGAVLFLASPLASYVTGQTLIVDGGLSL